MKKLIVMLACVFAAVASMADSSRGAVILSTSDTNANAGSSLSLELNTTGTMYVWVSTRPGQTMNGFSVNVVSSNPAVLQATSSTVFNAGNSRWNSTNGGTLGDLVTNQRGAAVFGATGISTGSLDTYALFSSINFNATAEGTTNLSMSLGSSGVSVTPSTTFDATFGSGSVTVSAIPEPGSMALLASVGAVGAYIRRRRMKASLSTVS